MRNLHLVCTKSVEFKLRLISYKRINVARVAVIITNISFFETFWHQLSQLFLHFAAFSWYLGTRAYTGLSDKGTLSTLMFVHPLPPWRFCCQRRRPTMMATPSPAAPRKRRPLVSPLSSRLIASIILMMTPVLLAYVLSWKIYVCCELGTIHRIRQFTLTTGVRQ